MAFTCNSVLLLNVGRAVNGLLIAVVPDSDIGTGLREGLGNRKTDTGTGTGDNCRSAFEGEQRHGFGFMRRCSVVVGKVASFHC